MNPLASLLLAGALLTTGSAVAQQNVGIYLSRGSTTLTGVLCGFDCNNPTNIGTATVNVLDVIDIRVLGESGLPAALLFSVRPWPCSGIPIPGVGNALLLDPGTMFIAASVTSLSGPARGSCGETANEKLLNQFTIPSILRSGTVIHCQGLAFDSGRPALTRRIDITIV